MEKLWLINIGVSFLLCIVASGILIPQILLIAYRKKLFDEPDERKIHRVPVPRLGGIAFTLVIFFSLAFVFGVNMLLDNSSILAGIREEITVISFGFCAVLLLYIVGIADDLIGVRYRAKFVVQIFAAAMLIAGGLYFNNFYGVLWLNEIPLWLAYPLTVLIIVFVINAINLIDGIDGLASGLCSIVFMTYGFTFLQTGDYMYAAIAFANLGVLLPFFYYNVFGKAENHKKIFMGDTGSLTIGISICLLGLKVLESVPTAGSEYPNPFIIAFAPLIIPCFDVVRVYMHRVRNRKNPFLPDKNHIHHKLLATGMKPYVAMITIIASSLILVFVNCEASRVVNVNILLALDVILVTAINIFLSRMIRRKKKTKTIHHGK